MSTPRWLPAAAALVIIGAIPPGAAAAAVAPVTLSVPKVVSGTTTVTVTSTKTPLVRVEVIVDKVVVATCPGSPCVHSWDTTKTPNGTHRVDGRAVKSRSQFWTVGMSVTVKNTAVTPPPPPPPPDSEPTTLPPPPGGDIFATLLGPIIATGSSEALVARYDSSLLTLGHQYASQFPAQPTNLVDSNYYDLALVLYTAYQRSGDPYWLEQARRVARAWRDSRDNQAIAPYLAGNWSLGSTVPPPRGMSTLGLAILALEAGDEQARTVVHLHARLIEQRWVNSDGEYGLSNPIMPMGDQREAAYGLIALVTSTLLGEDHTPAARRLLDAILARQLSSGQWRGWQEGGHVFTNNFMTGLLIEALALYDRALGDARIVPAIERLMGWMWSTQWVPATLSFKYDAEGTDTTPAPVLNGLFLAGWAHAYSRTGRTAYRDQGELIFRGLVDNGIDEIWSVKQFDQVYRTSVQYPGATRGQ